MALFRVESKAIDLVVTFNTPVVSVDGGAVGNEGVERSETDFDIFVRSLRIHDFGLFTWIGYRKANQRKPTLWFVPRQILHHGVGFFYQWTLSLGECVSYLDLFTSWAFSAASIKEVESFANTTSCDSTLTDCRNPLLRFTHCLVKAVRWKRAHPLLYVYYVYYVSRLPDADDCSEHYTACLANTISCRRRLHRLCGHRIPPLVQRNEDGRL